MGNDFQSDRNKIGKRDLSGSNEFPYFKGYCDDYLEVGLTNGKGFLERFGVSKSLDGTIDVSPLET